MTYGERYLAGLRAASDAAVSAEPEAQLTVPVANLFVEFAADKGLGRLDMLREAQLPGVRPDFAALIDGRPCGWVELKAPGHSLDGPEWIGREARQWSFLSELDSLVVTDGYRARLYQSGEQVGEEATLPTSHPWDDLGLATLLRTFVSARPTPVTNIPDLAARLASLTALLRDRVKASLGRNTPSSQRALRAWAINVHDGVSPEAFASDVAQVISYSLAIAVLSGAPDSNSDGFVTIAEARAALRGPHALLAASLGPVLEVDGFLDEIKVEVGAIERLISVVDRDRISRSSDSRGEPWLWFYEDFLAKYDPEARRQAGVYYTPIPVVETQVRFLEEILQDEFNKPLGFAAEGVITLDPATGSGTYPLAVIDAAGRTAARLLGAAGQKMAAKTLAKSLIGFELLPGPYAVAHLRIGRRLAEVEGAAVPQSVRVYLTDTLDDPKAGINVAPGLWGDAETLAVERARAARVRAEEPVTVILGNPPYARRDSSSGGWVVHPPEGPALFDDLLGSAREAGVIFSAQASLYNDYVYFWRWSIWKALQQGRDKPAIISFITASSWLGGPGFVGLRKMAQELGDEIWVLDLGGDGRGAGADDNIFAIQTPVAIVTIFRRGKSMPGSPARLRYRKIEGTRNEKLDALRRSQSPAKDPGAWIELQPTVGGRFLPAGRGEWEDLPALTDVFPWQQPGAKFNRAWPISPSRVLLKKRWSTLLEDPSAAIRTERFVPGHSGRNIHTRVNGLTPLAEVAPGAEHKPLVRYLFRPFDRQWTFEDARLAALERPALWQSRSDRQIFLIGLLTREIGPGPGLIVGTDVPDLHAFRGSYGGKDVIPLYRDASARKANITAGLLDQLSRHMGVQIDPEELASYVFAIVGHPAYQETFATDLRSPGLRFPLTKDHSLWRRAVALGRKLIWLQTFAERMRDDSRGNRIDRDPTIGWTESVSTIPAAVDQIRHDADNDILHVGDGAISGVTAEMWNFSVSGFEVVRRWFGSRTAKGVGLASGAKAKPLDAIRPTEWEDSWNHEALELLTVVLSSLRLYEEQRLLLNEVMEGHQFKAADLPIPEPAERAVPKTERLDAGQMVFEDDALF